MLRSIIERLGTFDFRRRRLPNRIADAAAFEKLIDQGVLDGFEPPSPFIDKSTPIITLGSCFAGNISRHLGERGYSLIDIDVNDRLFTPLALREFVDSVAGGAAQYDFSKRRVVNDKELSSVRQALANGCTVIITYGLSIVWRDKTTGRPIHDPTGKLPNGLVRIPDFSHYGMFQLSLSETTASIAAVMEKVLDLNPRNRIVVTVSPIPLAYAQSDYPVLVADSISKSTLRLAVDQVLQALKSERLFYFPSFEILKWAAPLVSRIWNEDNIASHIRSDWIAYVMSKFCTLYCTDAHDISPAPIEDFAPVSRPQR